MTPEQNALEKIGDWTGSEPQWPITPSELRAHAQNLRDEADSGIPNEDGYICPADCVMWDYCTDSNIFCPMHTAADHLDQLTRRMEDQNNE